MKRAGRIAAWLVCLPLAWPAAASETNGDASKAVRDEDGFLVHTVESPYQAGKTKVRVLLPEGMERGKRYPVVYVLPVEPGEGTRYGDGLAEIKQRGLHRRHRAIFAAPTFSDWPWYADHATKPEIRQESYFHKTVVLLVEKHYPALAKRDGRLLLGFSKSGWGAWSLLLRHPQTFARAAAWDAPMMMDQLGKYETRDIYGTPENFVRYRIVDLLRSNVDAIDGPERLILTGYGAFRQDHQRVHALMQERKIPHTYRDGPPRKHTWHSGWVAEAVELLLGFNED